MPDRLDIEDRLVRSRDAFLAEIDQPPLADVHRRAAQMRRRRHAVRTGSALVALAAIAGVVIRPWDQSPPPEPPEIAASAPVYRGEGIEITGLTPGQVFELDGEVVDVEFSDPEHGMAFSICQTCPTALARTTDGGTTWTEVTLPDGARSADLQLIAFPRGVTLLYGASSGFTSADGGATWRPTTAATAAPQAAVGPAQILRYDESTSGLAVWDPEHGPVGPLANQPPFPVGWVSPVPTADGAWWVGGVVDGEPALAVTPDAGATWTRADLSAAGGPVASVTFAMLGSHAYAVATGGDGSLRAVYHSANNGKTFTRTYAGGAKEGSVPARVSGIPVPLLDGRLLLTSQDPGGGTWWLSEDDGRSFTQAVQLPAVDHVTRTAAGYVAYGLFQGNWLAFSRDGSNWRKLQVY